MRTHGIKETILSTLWTKEGPKEMPNAKDAANSTYHNILLVGPTGSGKTTQIRTLPGKKFAYLFDPNALASLRGADVDYEEWLPDALELDTTIKGFNKGSKSDRPPSAKEPRIYVDWVADLTKKAEEEFFASYDWVCFDSLTFLQKSVFDRQMYLNNRFGGVEELADYRVVGSKLSDLFSSITSEQTNIFCTGHLQTFQDEKTKVITTQLNLSGQARGTIPLMFSDIWLAKNSSTEDTLKYQIQTRPAARGLDTIRSSVSGLEMYEDVTIENISNPETYGIGKILNSIRNT